ncbi:MAG: helix-hairpin-helix domain-containing protein [Sedimentisphaerales bacterium]|nr:helix-hairpin-helix domain-containing protein [Sedimentisphaerales bacterium]
MTSGSATSESGSAGDPVESAGFVLLVCICVAVAIPFVVTATRISANQVLLEIEDRVNPNHASPASLARLPRIGPARAQQIVSYRRRFTEQVGQRPAFHRAEDLREIRGIGPATIEAVRPWLVFDSLASDTPSAEPAIQGDREADSLE